jgi:hypothetical protein
MSSPRHQRAQWLARRRADLQAQGLQQRLAVAAAWQGLSQRQRWLDVFWRVGSQLRRQPWPLLLPLVAVVVWRPRWLAAASRVWRWTAGF